MKSILLALLISTTSILATAETNYPQYHCVTNEKGGWDPVSGFYFPKMETQLVRYYLDHTNKLQNQIIETFTSTWDDMVLNEDALERNLEQCETLLQKIKPKKKKTQSTVSKKSNQHFQLGDICHFKGGKLPYDVLASQKRKTSHIVSQGAKLEVVEIEGDLVRVKVNSHPYVNPNEFVLPIVSIGQKYWQYINVLKDLCY